MPAPLEFDGMPDTRWWAFEDGRTNFGDVDAATTDLAKLLFIEFGLVYANDWFLVPVHAAGGALAPSRAGGHERLRRADLDRAGGQRAPTTTGSAGACSP